MSRAARSPRRPAGWRAATRWSARMAAAFRPTYRAFPSSHRRWRAEPAPCKGPAVREMHFPDEGARRPENMMNRLLLLAPIAFAPIAFALAPAPSAAAPTVKRAMTCPVGGEAFDYQQPVSSAALGMRPDGKPYGTSAAPARLP